MDEEGESTGYRSRPGGSGHAFLPPLKERARRERRPAARPGRPGTVIEATAKCNCACSQGALRQKGTPCAAAMCCFESLCNRFYTTCGCTPVRDTPCWCPGYGYSQRKKLYPAPSQNSPSSGRKGDRLRWKEPAGESLANSCDENQIHSSGYQQGEFLRFVAGWSMAAIA